jgi:pimeloyl-ACP methyl ester carboxylesterase
MPDPADLRVVSEQLLLQFGPDWLPVHVRTFLPAGVPEQTLLCFHGFIGNGLDFAELAPVLAHRGIRVICPDMIGRGDSGRFDEPRRYDLRTVVAGAALVLERYADSPIRILGLHWGAIIAAVALQQSRRKTDLFIACGLPLDFDPGEDPIVRCGVELCRQPVGTLESAIAAIQASPEFGGTLPANLAATRLRHKDDMVSLACDPAIASATMRLAGRRYDLRGPLAEVAKTVVLLNDPGQAALKVPQGFVEYPVLGSQLVSRNSMLSALVTGLLLSRR